MRTPDGRVWSCYKSHSFWTRYLDVFDQVQVVARVADVATGPEPTWKRADGEAVTFHAVPYYVGPVQYAQRFFSIRRTIRNGIGEGDAVIMRVSSPIALHVESQLAPLRPFGLEVVGDANESFAPGAVQHPLRPYFRWRFTRELKRQCRKAAAVAYVTKVLQRRYPSREKAFWTSYSSIELDDTAFAPAPRSFTSRSGPIRLITVGTLAVMYKGFDILIDALSACTKEGVNLELIIVGGGRYRDELERRARVAGIEHRVIFKGELPAGEAVIKELDRADLFILPSRSEGLPRAMIEAMARGLPCIGSNVGGIPELLSTEHLVPRENAPALARKIKEVLSDPPRMTRMSATNRARARDYHNAALTARRREFYEYVRQATHDWNLRRLKDTVSTGDNGTHENAGT
jgi:glycosyltransferase involved in cell wall biosynthesis